MGNFNHIEKPRFSLIISGVNQRRGFLYEYGDLPPSFQKFADAVGTWDHGTKSGSCFVVAKGFDQFVITAAHCISDFKEAETAYAAFPTIGERRKISLFDKVPLPSRMRGADIAIARITPLTNAEGLKLPDERAVDNDQLQGQVVVSTGFPVRYKRTHNCQFPLSAIGAVRYVDWDTCNIETNVRIEAGSSGGPLYNSRGEVLGVASSVQISVGQNADLIKEERDLHDMINQTLPRRQLISYMANIYPVLEALG